MQLWNVSVCRSLESLSTHKCQKVAPCGFIACTVFLVTAMLLGVISPISS